MAGRKRKAGAREPNGRLDRKEAESSYAPAAIKRLTDRAIAAASDPRLGTEAGRLLLAGKLTTRQAGAAWRWAEIAADYARAIQAPQVKGATFERAAKSAAPDEGTDAAEQINRSLARAVQRYQKASTILLGCGRESERAVLLLCADVALLGHQQLIDARTGLDALAALFATGRSQAGRAG